MEKNELLDPPEAEEQNYQNELLKDLNKPANYYALLNVSRDASLDEIKAAYRRLSMAFHPDRHCDHKELAQNRFSDINQAYETLSDPEKRQVYDLYGPDGVDSMNEWKVGPTRKTISEIQASYERHELLLKKMEMEEIIQTSTGQMEITMDSSAIFDSSVREMRAQQLELQDDVVGLQTLLIPKVSKFQMSQGTSIKIDDSSDLSLSGIILVQRGHGLGFLVTSYHRSFAMGKFMQATMNLGSRSALILKSGLPVSKYSNVTGQITFPNWIINAPPLIESTYQHLLGVDTTGFVTYKTGEYSSWDLDDESYDSVEIGLTKKKGNNTLTGTLIAGLQESGILLKYVYRWSKAALLKFKLKLTSSDYLLSYGGNRTVFSKVYRLGANIEWSSNRGIYLTVEMSRYSQTLSVPFLITHLDSRIDLLCLITGVSALSIYACHRYIMEPYRKKMQFDRIQMIKEQTKEVIEKSKKEAIESIELLKKTIASKIETERSQNGLLITLARYGIPLRIMENTSDVWIDVTEAVQSNVLNSQLQFPDKVSKSSVIGFYDPCPWHQEKKLFVRYTFQNTPHEVLINDDDSLFIPMRLHIKE